MRRRLSSTLLAGAMTTAGIMAMIVLAAFVARNAQAQRPPALNAAASGASRLYVAFTYDAMHSDQVPGAAFWMQGAGAEIEGRFYRGWSAVAGVAGMQTGNINASGVGLDLVTALFGPRYTWSAKSRKYAVFGQALGGAAMGFNSVFPAVTGATSAQAAPAMDLGGGMNIVLTPRVALRAFQADWVRTELSNAGSNVQNSLRLGAGVVFRIR